MERGQAPKILCLVPDSMFISFLCPFFIHYLSWISILLPFFSLTAFKGQLVPRLHTIDALTALIIPGGFLHRSLIIYLGFMPRTCVILPHVPFLRHYMHRYDLSFGQAGLPGSCIYALRSR